MISEEDNIWNKYISEAVVPFSKRREVRKGMAKKHGKRILKPYTFGFDIEFKVPYDENMLRERLQYHEFNVEPISDDYKDWVESNMIEIDEPAYTDIDDWESDHPEPDRDDFTSNYDDEQTEEAEELDEEAFNQAYSEWEQTKAAVEEEIDKYRSHYDYAMENSLEDYIEHLIDSGEWKEYVNFSSGEIDYEIDEMRREINDALEDHKPQDDEDYDEEDLMGWDVSEDEARNYEVTSPILTTKDFPMIYDVLSVVGNYGESGNNTSAHIHIGIPDDFDFFDLLVLYDLVDEDKLERIQPDRFRGTTKLKATAFRNIAFNLERNYTNGDIIDISDMIGVGADRYMGINISNISTHLKKRKRGEKIKSGAGKTVEFRYLSSEIFDNHNGIEEFFEWIDYFMMLMKVAQKRNQFSFMDGEKKYILTRVNKDQIRLNIGKGSMPYEKPSELKQREGDNSERARIIKFNEKLYKQSTSDDFQKKHPKPDFRNMSKKDMKNWWLSTPEHAYQFIVNYPNVNELHLPKYQPFYDKIFEDYKVTAGMFNLPNKLPYKRIPKFEETILNFTAKTEIDKALFPMVVKRYVRFLYDKDQIGHEEYTKIVQYSEDPEYIIKTFKEIINSLDS